jgi:uncharacterized protein (UPF0303 family)
MFSDLATKGAAADEKALARRVMGCVQRFTAP